MGKTFTAKYKLCLSSSGISKLRRPGVEDVETSGYCPDEYTLRALPELRHNFFVQPLLYTKDDVWVPKTGPKLKCFLHNKNKLRAVKLYTVEPDTKELRNKKKKPSVEWGYVIPSRLRIFLKDCISFLQYIHQKGHVLKEDLSPSQFCLVEDGRFKMWKIKLKENGDNNCGVIKDYQRLSYMMKSRVFTDEDRHKWPLLNPLLDNIKKGPNGCVIMILMDPADVFDFIISVHRYFIGLEIFESKNAVPYTDVVYAWKLVKDDLKNELKNFESRLHKYSPLRKNAKGNSAIVRCRNFLAHVNEEGEWPMEMAVLWIARDVPQLFNRLIPIMRQRMHDVNLDFSDIISKITRPKWSSDSFEEDEKGI